MNCAWDQYLRLLPAWMRPQVDQRGRDRLLELRLRIDQPPELVFQSRSEWLERKTQPEDLTYCINAASGYSPWASETSSKGYITAPGGHRIGICGSYVAGRQTNQVKRPDMLCLRVARDFPGIAKNAIVSYESTLIIGRPGSGKTTLLRDLIRQYADEGGVCVSVVDEREELFPRTQNGPCFYPGRRTDILSGCSKVQGIEMVLRNMTPSVIAIDEITAQEDCEALLHAGWCGVQLLASAHAGSLQDLQTRPIYRPLVESHLFRRFFVMKPDKSWHVERSTI